jgi:dCTP deaminase
MNSTTPWKDERWMPGVLNKSQLNALIDAKLILNTNKEKEIDWDASALDLYLSSEGYEMIKGSIKPFHKRYGEIINDPVYAERLIPDSDGIFSLKKGRCYLFKIKEQLSPDIKRTPIYGQATAKSTVGRVDVIARLIVDGMKEYEKFNPREVVSGEMFLEITSITFDVKVKEGISISQLRFFYGEIENSIIDDVNFIKSILQITDEESNNGTLSVNISNEKKDNIGNVAAFRAKQSVQTPIELWNKNRYLPNDFWLPVQSTEIKGLISIEIRENEFYIIRSNERILLNESACIYCRAMDETLGEMRIHYAGFVHPCFGEKRNDTNTGTPLIFEVRGHNVKVLLTDKEILARLFFYRMSESAKKPPESTGEQINIRSDYGDQELKLSALFQEKWS